MVGWCSMGTFNDPWSNLRIYSFLCFGIGDFPTANDCRAVSADDPVWSLLHHLRLGALHALRQGQKLDRELDEKLDWSAGNVCERFESCELNILLVPGKTNLSWDWVLTISSRMGMVWDKACQPCQTCGFLGGYEDIFYKIIANLMKFINTHIYIYMYIYIYINQFFNHTHSHAMFHPGIYVYFFLDPTFAFAPVAYVLLLAAARPQFWAAWIWAEPHGVSTGTTKLVMFGTRLDS